MTAPLVTTSRDALAEALCPSHHRVGFGGSITSADGLVRSIGGSPRPCLLHASQADALLASGVVRTADTAEDAARAALRALAAALEDR